MLDAKIHATFEELCSFELCTIIYQNSYGYAESVYNALQEPDHCILGYIYCCHGFHPLGERVNSDEQISEPTWCPGKMPTM
jgi:hypothetical protein